VGFSLDVAGHAVWLPGVALLGVGVGWTAGMFGVGGGFLLTPLLTVIPFTWLMDLRSRRRAARTTVITERR
jgi:uncharacterized membrane protein YfcA